MNALVKKIRKKSKRKESPIYAIIDSQSVKTAYKSEERGIDGNKKIKWRKRHIVVDAMGNLLAITVHDAKFGINPAEKAFEKYPTIKKFCGAESYRKSFEEAVLQQLGLSVDILKRIKPEFEVLPKRWIVERAFAWANNSSRLAKDFELSTASAENMAMISHIATLLKRF